MKDKLPSKNLASIVYHQYRTCSLLNLNQTSEFNSMRQQSWIFDQHWAHFFFQEFVTCWRARPINADGSIRFPNWKWIWGWKLAMRCNISLSPSSCFKTWPACWLKTRMCSWHSYIFKKLKIQNEFLMNFSTWRSAPALTIAVAIFSVAINGNSIWMERSITQR